MVAKKKPAYNPEGEVNEETPSGKSVKPAKPSSTPASKLGKKNPFGGKKK